MSEREKATLLIIMYIYKSDVYSKCINLHHVSTELPTLHTCTTWYICNIYTHTYVTIFAECSCFDYV